MGEITDPRVMGNRIAIGREGFYDFDSPALSVFGLDDLIRGMAGTLRFSGQLPYSVLQHSLNVYYVARDLGAADDVARQALFHDAHETLVGDTVRPLWKKLREVGQEDGLAELETQARELLAERFQFEPITFEVVQQADDHVLALETRDGFEVDPATWGTPLLPGASTWLVWASRAPWYWAIQYGEDFARIEQETRPR